MAYEMNNNISNGAIRKCNNMMRWREKIKKAKRIYDDGTKIGISYKECEGETVWQIEAMEKRGQQQLKKATNAQRRENDLSDQWKYYHSMLWGWDEGSNGR